MTVAVWIIAVMEVIRAAQNFWQLYMVRHDTQSRDDCYAEFVHSLKSTDREFVESLLKEFDRQEGASDDDDAERPD